MEQGRYLTPFQRQLLQDSLQPELRAEYRRRIEIMLLADQGMPRTQICQTVGCASETARFWIAIAQAGNAHLWDTATIGRPKVAPQHYCDRLKILVTNSPRHYGYAFQHWTAKWLSKHLEKELGITVSDRQINRLLKEMGLSTRTQRNPIQPNSPASELTISDLVVPVLSANNTTSKPHISLS